MQLDQMIKDVQRRIDVLEKNGEGRLATALDLNLRTFISQREARDYPVSLKAPEVHWVGLYQATNDSPGPVHVRVSYTGAPIVLVLTAYDRVLWNVRIDEDVQIETVIISGYKEQWIEGLPETVKIENHSGRESKEKPFYAHSRNDGSFRQGADRIRELSGRPVVTFQGSYGYSGEPFVVGPKSSDWRTQHIIARLVPLHEDSTQEERRLARQAAQEIKFTGLFVSGGEGPSGRGAKASWGSFTANGPLKDQHLKLPQVFSHVAVDSKSKKWFAIFRHGLVGFEPSSKELTYIPKMPFELPELSHPCGLAFDEKRQRLLVCSLGGKGFLYSFDTTAKEWSLLGSMNNVDALAMAWSPIEDCLYTISADRRDRTRYALVRMTMSGIITREVLLGREIPNLGHMPNCQLIPHKEKMVLLAPGPLVGAQRHGRPATHCYLMNPLTGAVDYATELQPQPSIVASE